MNNSTNNLSSSTNIGMAASLPSVPSVSSTMNNSVEWELIDDIDDASSHRTIHMDMTSPVRHTRSISATSSVGTPASDDDYHLPTPASSSPLPSLFPAAQSLQTSANNGSVASIAPSEPSVSVSSNESLIMELQRAVEEARKEASVARASSLYHESRADRAEQHVAQLTDELRVVTNERDDATKEVHDMTSTLIPHHDRTIIALNHRIRALQNNELQHLQHINMLNSMILHMNDGDGNVMNVPKYSYDSQNDQTYSKSSSRSHQRFNGNDTRAYRRMNGGNNSMRRSPRQSYTCRRAC